ncbi:MAG: tyrosine-type recombinase/integrase [Treponema sp.]|uniref:tyrosine-type recombinase/integrase n=1 Tax=Treponema sp. TaxID=166 RepID=UPI0025D75BF8|nr:tyrosine-type recombinase/integrase [Treponema sp.]MBQ8680609.1 tyrosine-type recombinase/integrase [Treponema sp.]
MRGYFFVFRRTLKSGNKIYYYQAYKPDGSLATARSTGCTRKAAAVRYCETLLLEGKLWAGANLTFRQYAEHFFDNDSIWVMDRLALGTKEHPALSENYLSKLQQTVRTHLLPYFGDKKLSFIKPTDIKEYRLYLIREKKLSYKSINDIVATFKTITDTAMSDNILMYSPLRGIKPLMKNPSPREAFTLDDAKQILLEFRWKNQAHRFFNLVGALTGMRLSELHAIRKDNLKDTCIDLQDQFLNGKLRPLKTKEARKIPICEELHGLLSERISESGSGYAFYDVAETMASDTLREVLQKNMPEKKKEKGYCFHSWRHFFNTYLLSKNVSPVKVAAVLGHSTGVSSVQERYTNFTEADYEEIYALQKTLFAELKYWE